ncbi:MAG: PUA domain-containing protein, partial [Candidatus Aenigmatarchaeota archaeon]
ITRIQKDIIRGETVAIMTLKEELIALGISKMTSEEIFKRKTGTAVRVDRVLMPRGIYPKWDKA